MPSSLTHTLFAQFLQGQYDPQLPFLKSYANHITAGSLGPDPLFFAYGLKPRYRDSRNQIKNLGKQLHLQDPLLTFWPMFQYAEKGFADRNARYSYLFGMLSHYVLDHTLHPYVFYWSGFDEASSITKMPYKVDHVRLENSLDLLFLDYFGLKFEEYNPLNVLNVSPRVLQDIDGFYQSFLDGFPQIYSQAYQTMEIVFNVLFDVKMFKRALIKFFFHKRSYLYCLTHTRFLNKEKATLIGNLDHRQWRHPSTGAVMTKSAIDLFKVAVLKFNPWIQLFRDSYSGKHISRESLRQLLGFTNFDGDVVGAEKLFFSSIYPAYKHQPKEKNKIPLWQQE